MKKLGKKTPLTEEEARAKIDEYKSPDFLTDKQKKIYDMMREQFDTAHKIGSKTMLDEKNTMIKYVENYRPIVMDRGLNKINFQEEDFDMSELQKSMTKMGVTQTLDKQTTAKETIPLIEAR